MPKFFLAATLTAFSISAAAASADTLSDDEIKSLIMGKKVVLSTKWGAFPLRYNANKSVVGDGSALGLARFFSPKETGQWWVQSNRLCQKFPTWYKGKSHCFSLTVTGQNKLRWVRGDGFAGTATVSQ